jgi:hypothetical protein
MDITNPSHPLNIANPANPASPLHHHIQGSSGLTWVDAFVVLCIAVVGLYILHVIKNT